MLILALKFLRNYIIVDAITAMMASEGSSLTRNGNFLG